MRLFILGICGTFMAGVALLAKQKGFDVIGCDEKVYPPMSTQLQAQGIEILNGYDPAYLSYKPDLFIIGNVVRRGNPLIEAILNAKSPYQSGPAWLSDAILADRHVLAIAGTHGKTTTSSLLTFILQASGMDAGFLIGGLAPDLGKSAHLGTAPFFVIEADEYDSAFFDKRSKFIHYHPQTLVLNNLEFDHADIFDNLADIKRQFQYLIRTVSGNARIIHNQDENHLNEVLAQGCWTPREAISLDKQKHPAWFAQPITADCTAFELWHQGKKQGHVAWTLLGQHNMANALSAIAASYHVGIPVNTAMAAIANFKGVTRRLEVKGVVSDITIYDDFAHHPTAITHTLKGLRAKVGQARILAILELGSYTMRTGRHGNTLGTALHAADQSILVAKNETRDADYCEYISLLTAMPGITTIPSTEDLIEHLLKIVHPGDHIIVMSNTGFAKVIPDLLHALSNLQA